VAGVQVTETFFALEVADMARASAFYQTVFGATVRFASAVWTSLDVAGVRIGLAPSERAGASSGLHFAVTDLAEACRDVERGGGRVLRAREEVAPGITLASIADTEGNAVTLRGP
jgi:predicted enzyme related to lactoylglutathione lyase